MSGGVHVSYHGSWSAKGQHTDEIGDWQIEGTKGSLVYRRGELHLYETTERYEVLRDYPVVLRALAREGQLGTLDEFLRGVEDDAGQATPVEDNLRTMAMVFASVEALRSGERVRVLDEVSRSLLAG